MQSMPILQHLEKIKFEVFEKKTCKNDVRMIMILLWMCYKEF